MLQETNTFYGLLNMFMDYQCFETSWSNIVNVIGKCCYNKKSLKGRSQPMCIARRVTIRDHFLCHRNSDLTSLKEKSYRSVLSTFRMIQKFLVLSVWKHLGVLSRMFRDK